MINGEHSLLLSTGAPDIGLSVMGLSIMTLFSPGFKSRRAVAPGLCKILLRKNLLVLTTVEMKQFAISSCLGNKVSSIGYWCIDLQLRLHNVFSFIIFKKI